MRIVSLLPSATEIVCELGLEAALVGVTHECDHPAAVRGLPRVTRTLIPTDASSREIDELVRERLRSQRALYELDLPVLERLAPDLIVTQALCDVCAVAEAEVSAAACRLPGEPRVVNLEPMSLGEVLASLETVADAAGVPEAGVATVTRLRARIDAVADRSTRVETPPRVMLLEWIDPPFTAGHWSPEIVRLAGGREVLGREGEKSRSVPWQEIVAADPEVLVIACCGFDISRTRQDLPILLAQPGFSGLACTRDSRVFLVDGNAYFSRPGPRLVESLEILAHALHPTLHPLPVGLRPAERLSAAELGASPS
jgi:iron complex transport system substrate-binding protein